MENKEKIKVNINIASCKIPLELDSVKQEEYVRAAEKTINEVYNDLCEKFPGKPTQDLIITTALNIAARYIEVKNNLKNNSKEANELLKELKFYLNKNTAVSS